MKKVFLSILLIVLYFGAKSQFFLDLTEKEALQQLTKIKSLTQFSKRRVPNESGTSTLNITWRDNSINSYGCLMFNADNISTILCLLPDNKNDLENSIQTFNKKYVNVSSTEWESYSGSEVIKISIRFAQSGSFGIYFQKKK